MKHFCKHIALGLAHVTAIHAMALPLPDRQDQEGRRNVLFIAVDDMRTDLGCYGHSVVKSPHLDMLARSSLQFNRAYCQQAVCNPSRASLLTGLRPETLNVTDLPTHFREHFPDIFTLPQWFKEKGYHTENIGKIFHNWRQDSFKGDPNSWSIPARMHYATHGSDRAVVKGTVPRDLLDLARAEKRHVSDDAYFDGRIASEAIRSMKRLKTSKEAFFLAVGFWKPHLPLNAPKRYWDLYDPKSIQLPKDNHPPLDVPSLAMHDSRELLRSFPDGLSSEQIKTLRHGYYAAISYVDAQIGRVLNALDALDLRRNTIVVFWSDHGFHMSEHGLWCKTSNFELDTRVPLMISTPDMQGKGRQTDALVELLDLYPTLVDLCAMSPPPHKLEGLSLQPLLKETKTSVKHAAFTQHPRPAYVPVGTSPRAMGYSMRTKRWRYTEWRAFDTGKVLATELYDHMLDTRETLNLAYKDPYKERIQQLRRALEDTYPSNASHQSVLDESSPQERPNMVLIVADDLGYGDLGCYGSKRNKTPNLDRMAREGVRFTDFHSNGSMCTPTRAALLTGRYQQRLGTLFEGPLSGRSDYQRGLPMKTHTLAEALKAKGYETGMFGKWHLGYQAPHLPTQHGFNTFVGLASGDGDHHTHVDRSGRPDWWHQETRKDEKGYTADLLTDHAIRFMQTHRDRPFFVYLPHLAIHFPWQGPDDPGHRTPGNDYWDDKWGRIPDPSNVAPHVEAMVASLDWNVGRILKVLKDLHIDGNTMVFFMSDNGGYIHYGETHQNISSNGQLRGQKGSLWEGGQRVPAIAWWPGRIPPGITDETVMGFDLFPTLMSLTGKRKKHDSAVLDGIDCSRLLLSGEPLPHRNLFWRDGKAFAVRSGPWKLLRTDDRQLHLFDLYHDQSESYNLATKYPERVGELFQRFQDWQSSMGL
ncbi:sulfatase-like hydrolase/transferase [Verrucomicrobia bacterium]|nr:sulfatase-like hydrolase/transferase [Verrucomicrobiota bacterium]MDB4664858.1 sulfatase-like hydrolase/transferase [Verrucomicrobiota bacterium]